MTLHEPLPDTGRVGSAPVPPTLCDGGTRGWVCVSCRASNGLDLDMCATCGASFSAFLRADSPQSAARLRVVVPALRETGMLLALFVLWRVASSVSLMQEAGAFARGRELWSLERHLHLPSEVIVQASILAHPTLVRALDIFYLVAHIGGMAALLGWLFVLHRAQYRQWRNLVVAFTGCSLVIQFISIAPPRLLPQFGFVDTAARYHQSAYQHLGRGLAGQLATMPSIHVGWALIAAVAVVGVSRSPWRWVVLLHPVLTIYAVTATANHFWLDSAAAAALVGLLLARQHARRASTATALPDEA